MGGVVCRLVQPSAPPQRHQVRDASATSQRPGRGDLSASRCRVRASTPAKPTPLVTIHTLLASARNGLDQSTTSGRRIQTSYVDAGCLNSSRSIIFPGYHRYSRPRIQCLLTNLVYSISETSCNDPGMDLLTCLQIVRQDLCCIHFRANYGCNSHSFLP